MSTSDGPWADGTPCWIDLAASDVGGARPFYETLFGWAMQESPPEAGGYLVCLKNGRAAAGIGPKMMPEAPTAWTTYLATTDVDAVVAKVSANGGQVLAPPMDVMDLGRMAICADPGGAHFGLWQPGSFAGAAIVNEPGAYIWGEQLSSSWEASKAFYGALFDWQYNDMSAEGARYASFQVGGRDVGGVGAYGPDDVDRPAQWWVYFAVDDTDEAVDQVVKLGGDVIRPPEDTPYGRMATVADDQGATFCLMSAPPANAGS